MEELLARAAAALRSARALVICAGAGMGVDSGLPDFRGKEGFWRAYPPYRKLNLSFSHMANPRWFAVDPAVAWGFYGHRMNLYRATIPHEGFRILGRWAARMDEHQVFTSNVDGHFQKAGFDPDRVVECHGSIQWLQCTSGCGIGLWPAGDLEVQVDPTTFRAAEPLPHCPRCGALARPNILMFGDWGWDASRTKEQEWRMRDLLAACPRPAVVVECGAGEAIPTVRMFSEDCAHRLGGLLIRINTRDFGVPEGHVGLPVGALEGLTILDRRLGQDVPGDDPRHQPVGR